MTNDTNSPIIQHSSLFQPRNRRLLAIAGGLLLLAAMTFVIVAVSRNTTIFPVTINGKIGYINRAGKVVIPPQFLDAGRFEDGLAPVLAGNTWGYIDKDGKLDIAPQFDVADPFSDGRALVGMQGKFGYIGKKGTFVINPQYIDRKCTRLNSSH